MNIDLKENEYITSVKLNPDKDTATISIGNKLLEDYSRTEIHKLTAIIGTYTLNKVTHANFDK